MPNSPVDFQRRSRTRRQAPASVPQPLEDEDDLVAVDTTWGELQPLQCAPGVVTVGELELIDSVRGGALLVDTRMPDSKRGVTLPGAVGIPHDQIAQRSDELDPSRVNIVFCNGPQCPQSPDAIRRLLDAGFPAGSLAYYRGGLHDWVTLAMPTAPVA
ncbi:Rhodanese-like protein [Mycolicibacterium chubuense NBB4]|uniref:Rhodanese-like protein n=1 Tax=Mycolicibacterium chubuense (strain NBB4) TaxID=710421 RepID=I4BN30_MYCCN|nr:rhodanese-like domain-containing protein [Mycolicibacterium chubuense]AFM18687.1 Rhodanese-like protein [Mycolicibacterium chubuense NBB4]